MEAKIKVGGQLIPNTKYTMWEEETPKTPGKIVVSLSDVVPISCNITFFQYK